METFQKIIQQRTGWSESIVRAIQTKEEADIYRIDPDYLMPEWWIKEYGENWRDWSNSDLMAEGYPPHDENGDPYELHHIGQWTDSPLAELTWAQHREGKNFSILHNLDDYSDIDRNAFVKEKSAHWIARYGMLNK